MTTQTSHSTETTKSSEIHLSEHLFFNQPVSVGQNLIPLHSGKGQRIQNFSPSFVGQPVVPYIFGGRHGNTY